jgi:hypothetical protein
MERRPFWTHVGVLALTAGMVSSPSGSDGLRVVATIVGLLP